MTLRFVLKSEFNLNRSKLCRLDNLFKFPLDCEEQANELLRRVFLGNLFGSLSRTLQQYSPRIEWIMCELRVFPVF